MYTYIYIYIERERERERETALPGRALHATKPHGAARRGTAWDTLLRMSSERGMLRLETLIELKLLNSRFSSLSSC